MKGTEKQIKWAEDIKAGAYNTLDMLQKENDRLTGMGLEINYQSYTDMASPEAIEAVRNELNGFFSRCDNAGTIINNRSMFQSAFLVKHCRDWMRAH